ncbi:hypothetical protein GS501_02400 [Saccharibacter sp. 17.LH.SD]|uniref:DNA circularization N-terminal domain-containing protein n=1 Tax=Saccharibacter sp. 17.LH.SD TaxID=2689393 RepID=UPI001367FDF0|nr:DNA circularization N-terminal domain-containing protein [Saccharibacter sp. 17.LH.SD]MXV43903.1 hypothetical protein [Saccharibacter sp. 17.LH.SD]
MDTAFGLEGLGGSLLSQWGSGLAGGLFSRFATLASLGGVSFAIVNSHEEIGRRITRVLFPDLPPSKQIFQDFGAIDTPITITGLIVGDDYVIRAERMRKVLATPGKLTLLHPWWGRLKVRLIKPAQISFDEGKIRLAHFQAQLVRDPDPPAPKGFFGSLFDSINNLLTEADALLDEAQTALAEVLSAASLPLTLVNSISSLISQGKGVWDSLTVRFPEQVKAAIVEPQAVMAAGVVAPRRNLDESYSTAVWHALIVTPAALVGSISAEDNSVVAPAGNAQFQDNKTITGQQIAGVLLSGSERFGQIADQLSLSNPDPASVLTLGVAARSVIVSQLASAWSECSFVSNDEAQALATQMTGAMDALTNDIVAASSARASVSLQPIFGRLQAVRAALMADVTARIGSLPAVVEVPVVQPQSLWSICYALEGDNVANVQPLLDDAAQRNNLLHPALTGPGIITVLEPNDDGQ